MNFPNKLTIFRVLLIPIIMIIAAFETLQEKTIGFMTLGNFIILLIFIVGVITDFLDGYIARKYQLITDFGKFADPLADKILVLALLIILLEQNSLLPGYIVTIILAREFIVTGFRVIAAGKNIVIAAGWLGKIKTNFQFLMVIMLLVGVPFSGTYLLFDIITLIVVYLTALLTIISGFEYIYKNRSVIL